jgi:hypothetical protein
MAASLRIVVGRDGQLSRAPSVAELEFLKYLRKNGGYDRRNVRIS